MWLSLEAIALRLYNRYFFWWASEKQSALNIKCRFTNDRKQATILGTVFEETLEKKDLTGHETVEENVRSLDTFQAWELTLYGGNLL
jgi:hypothetical protein